MWAFAWAGAAMFVVALGYFLFSYTVRYAVASPGPADWNAIVWNSAFFSLFALHHSLFARTALRAWVARIVPQGLERSFYVWIASLLLIAVCAFWRPVGGVAWDVDGAARWVLRAGQIAGIWLAVHSAVIIDVWDLAGVRASAPDGAIEFKTAGPYGWVRHPIYAGWFLLVFSVGTMTMTQLVFAVISSAYVLIAIPFEERSLRATTGGAYDRYQRQVASKLVPGVY